MTTTQTSSYNKWLDEYTTAKVSLASDGRGFTGEVWLFSCIAREYRLDAKCSHSHTTREDALACATTL